MNDELSEQKIALEVLLAQLKALKETFEGIREKADALEEISAEAMEYLDEIAERIDGAIGEIEDDIQRLMEDNEDDLQEVLDQIDTLKASLAALRSPELQDMKIKFSVELEQLKEAVEKKAEEV